MADKLMATQDEGCKTRVIRKAQKICCSTTPALNLVNKLCVQAKFGELDTVIPVLGMVFDGHTRIWAKLPKMLTLEPNKMSVRKTYYAPSSLQVDKS